MEGRTYDLARSLLDCACAELAETCPTRHCVVPGLPSFEDCCEGERHGQLTVHVVRRYPSRQFPTPDFGSPQNCDAPWVVAQYQLTIVRCYPTSGAHGPSCEALDATAQRTTLDLERVWKGVACCLKDRETVEALLRGGYQWVFGNQESVEPQGGCAGSTLDVLVGMHPCLECP